MLSALVTAAAIVSALPGSFPAQAARPRAPDLSIRSVRAARDGASPSAGVPLAAREASAPAPPCLGEVCQPRVSIPGHEPRYARPSRTELAAVYLERARLEPFATVAWVLLATGVRLEYDPPIFDGSRAPSRFGTFFVRMRLRVGADNLPVVPRRRPGR